MAPIVRPYRSVLYIPGSNARALDKARNLPVDAIIFDLEDAVAVEEKTNARGILAGELSKGGYGSRSRLVRVNGLETEWGNDDLAAFNGAGVDGILLPKVNGADDVDVIAGKVGDLPLWAMIETPLGVLNVTGIAAHPRIAGLVMGTNDLAKELGSRVSKNREPLLMSLQMALLGARAAGVICVDGVFNAFKDMNGLRIECEQGRDLGFDGKTLIHPAQIEIANTAFAPSEVEIELARRQIAAFERARAQGKGVAVVDGQIVENLHVETARALLDKLEAINTDRGK